MSVRRGPKKNNAGVEYKPTPYDIEVLKKLYELRTQYVDVYTISFLTSNLYGECSDSKRQSVYDAVSQLMGAGLVVIKKEKAHRNYIVSGKGKRYLDGFLAEEVLRDTTESQEELQVEPPAPDIEAVYPSQDNWDELHSDILRQFDALPDDSNTLYTTSDSTENFKGAVYTRIGNEAFCIGYVDNSDEILPSPEAIYAKIAGIEDKKNIARRTFQIYFAELLNEKLKIDKSLALGTAVIIYDGKYRNVESLVIKRKILTDPGKDFLNIINRISESENQITFQDSSLKTISIKTSDIYRQLSVIIDPKFRRIESGTESKTNPRKDERKKRQFNTARRSGARRRKEL